MWHLLALTLPAAAEDTYLGRFMAGTSSTFGGSSQYNYLFILLGLVLTVLIVNLTICMWAKDDYYIRHVKKIPAFEVWLFLLFGPISLLFYLNSRPPGTKAMCPYCEKMKLKDMPACPHCGHDPNIHTHHARHPLPQHLVHHQPPHPPHAPGHDQHTHPHVGGHTVIANPDGHKHSGMH